MIADLPTDVLVRELQTRGLLTEEQAHTVLVQSRTDLLWRAGKATPAYRIEIRTDGPTFHAFFPGDPDGPARAHEIADILTQLAASLRELGEHHPSLNPNDPLGGDILRDSDGRTAGRAYFLPETKAK